MMLIYEVGGKVRAKIQQDEAAGFYLLIFDLASGACTHDHLQDTLDSTLEQAEEEYSLGRGGWTQKF